MDTRAGGENMEQLEAKRASRDPEELLAPEDTFGLVGKTEGKGKACLRCTILLVSVMMAPQL